MKKEIDWTNAVRDALREVEMTPPKGGWAQLERQLAPPAPRRVWLRTPWLRVAAAAAAVLICVVAGEWLWQADRTTNRNEQVLTSATTPQVAPKSSSVVSPTATQPLAAAVQRLRAELPALQVAAAEHIALSQRSGVRSSVEQSAQDTLQTEQLAQQAVAHVAKELDTMQVAESLLASSAAVKTSAEASAPPTAAGKAAYRSAFAEDRFETHASARTKTALALFGGGGVTGSNSSKMGRVGRTFSTMQTVDHNTNVSMLLYDYGEGVVRHHQPISFGLSVRKEFAHGLSLESGVNYSLLLSDVEMPMGGNLKQKLHFIGVPLRMNWNFLERRRFLLYMGAGGMVEKCVSAKFGAKSFDESALQWSLLGALGAEYRLGGMVGLYFEPEVSYYLTDTQLRTVRTDSPLTVTLRLGGRLSF